MCVSSCYIVNSQNIKEIFLQFLKFIMQFSKETICFTDEQVEVQHVFPLFQLLFTHWYKEIQPSFWNCVDSSVAATLLLRLQEFGTHTHTKTIWAICEYQFDTWDLQWRILYSYYVHKCTLYIFISLKFIIKLWMYVHTFVSFGCWTFACTPVETAPEHLGAMVN